MRNESIATRKSRVKKSTTAIKPQTDQNEMSVIKEKEIRLTNAQAQLKKEFIGIDNVIDSIVSNIRVWYLFPKMISKPLVINLWGLTGCGKTSLVNRLCELLEIHDKTICYNLAKLDEDNSTELEDNITENIPNKERNPVFIFDEFQFAATKSEDGKEKDNKTALKTIWEIIDSGIFRAKLERYVMSHFAEIIFLSSYMDKSGVTIKKGKLVNIERVIGSTKSEHTKDDKQKDTIPIDTITDIKMVIDRYFNYDEKQYDENDPTSSWCEVADRYIKNKKNLWFSAQTISTLYTMYYLIIDDSMQLYMFEKMLTEMTIKDLMQFLYKLETKAKSGFSHDYSGSLVFVIGNVDEAYTISYNVNPDMDADQFHEITSKLSMVDIKEALQERFRNEQIARLGNIMLMYPSFSSENFTNIIKLRLEQYKKRVLENFGINIGFDESIVDVIYKDGVFPTQGTRPVFSSVYEIVETKLPHIMLHAYENNNCNIELITLSYADNKVIAEITQKNGGEKQRIEFKQELKIEDLRKNKRDEQQALTAVHESMHFVMYAKLFGKIPDKLVSNCVSDNANGFMMPSRDDKHFISKNEYLAHIQVAIAGYVAEKRVFGCDEISSGASNDLLHATIDAMDMVKNYGMFSDIVPPCVYTYLQDAQSTSGGCLVNNDYDNSVISDVVKQIIRDCENSVKLTMDDPEWYNMFVKSSKYLFDNVSMPKDVMRQLYEEVSEEKRSRFLRSETYYRDRLQNL